MNNSKSVYLNGDVLCENVQTTSVIQKARGRMFTLSMPQELGLVFNFGNPKPVAIHMMFVFYPLGVL